MEIICNTAD